MPVPTFPPSTADDAGPAELIPVPPGCSSPQPADVAFIGTAIDKDFEKVRYRIVQLRAGSASGSSVDGLIDVLYFDDAKFIDVGEDYLVGARFEPGFGQMYSTVRRAEPLFGGNDVIGVEDTDIDCPVLDDPVRTVKPDGTSVDSGVLSPLLENKRTLLATLGVPALVGLGVLLAMILLRSLWGMAVTGILELGRAAVTPVPDHKAVRLRTHRSDEAT